MLKLGRVFVGMSGGVDSSVAAALLKRVGYEVVGVFIRVWEPPEPFRRVCTWREDRREAMRVAARLDIPLLTLDLSRAYEKAVVKYMIEEYRLGRTPNPDVECNREIKFGLFHDWARRRGADFVATGHYVRLRAPRASSSTAFRLFAAKDKAKDQSYFLWTLTQRQLKHCLFPVGNYQKTEVRRLAKKFGLPNAAKKDSQGLCFIGRLDAKPFLKNFIGSRPGQVTDIAGRIIGKHEGVWFYTVGERHGFKVDSGGPFYVIAKDNKHNLLVVDTRQPQSRDALIISGVNWITGERPSEDKMYHCRIRHRGELVPCSLVPTPRTPSRTPVRREKTDRRASAAPPAWLVCPLKPVFAPAAGQSLVLYHGEELLGGGVIENKRDFKSR